MVNSDQGRFYLVIEDDSCSGYLSKVGIPEDKKEEGE